MSSTSSKQRAPHYFRRKRTSFHQQRRSFRNVVTRAYARVCRRRRPFRRGSPKRASPLGEQHRDEAGEHGHDHEHETDQAHKRSTDRGRVTRGATDTHTKQPHPRRLSRGTPEENEVRVRDQHLGRREHSIHGLLERYTPGPRGCTRREESNPSAASVSPERCSSSFECPSRGVWLATGAHESRRARRLRARRP